MIGLLQRVCRAEVFIGEERIAGIEKGLLLLLGIGTEDGPEDIGYIVRKTADLRIFSDAGGNLNLSIRDVGGEVLVVSQFTLLGNTRKGRRPSFTAAAPPAVAEKLYTRFIKEMRSTGIPVQQGRFGAMMEVKLTNSGPVTLILNSRAQKS